MKNFATVYWLLPANAERELFDDVVGILANQLNGPKFVPHLTLFSGSEIKDKNVARRLLIEMRTGGVGLDVREVTFSSEFTKTLFVRFEPSPHLKEFATKLAHVVNSPATGPADPHLSLLYKKLPSATKKELVSTIQLPFRTVIFDSLAAVRCVSPSRTRADVESWEILATTVLPP